MKRRRINSKSGINPRGTRTRFRRNSPKIISIDPTGFHTNPKGGSRLWRTKLAWFREIDFSHARTPPPTRLVLDEGNSRGARTRFRRNSPKTISISPTGFNTNPKGGNRLWRTKLAWVREIDFSQDVSPLPSPCNEGEFSGRRILGECDSSGERLWGR